MSRMISLRLADEQIKALDRAVGEGRFSTRTQAVRVLVADFAREERRRALAERFREAYSTPPSADEADLHEFLSEAARHHLGAGG